MHSFGTHILPEHGPICNIMIGPISEQAEDVRVATSRSTPI